MEGGSPQKTLAELKAAGRNKQRSSPRKQPPTSSEVVGASGDAVDEIAVEIMGMSISDSRKEPHVVRFFKCRIMRYSSKGEKKDDTKFARQTNN